VIQSPRLIPAVILGAMGLLALKLLAWTAEPSPGPTSASQQAVADKPAAEKEVWGLAKIIARAHAPDTFLDPMVTGTIDPPEPKLSPEEQARRDAAATANPSNKAGLMNGTAQPVSASERALLERLSKRREEIEARMRELDMREKLLDNAEKKLGGRVEDLKTLEEKVEGPKKKDGEESQAIKNLVIMYETMKPKDAARVFDRLSLDVMVPVVQQMNPRKMSDVLAAMSPEAAERLTVALSLRGRAAGAERTVAAAPAGPAGNELPAIEPARRR
jgi:flagellar motility protein MotE (MotC chaperone)